MSTTRLDMSIVRRWKRYPEYRTVTHRWLSSIPSMWTLQRISWLFGLMGSGTTPSTGDESYFDGEIPWVNTGDLNDSVIDAIPKSVTDQAIRDHSALKVYPEGTLLIALYGATIGKLGILPESAVTNQACFAMARPKNVEPRFLLYWLLGNREHIVAMSYGGGQPNISGELIRSLRVALPSLSEQRAIASFLDSETIRIDALIERKERLIALLEEKRQAVISHAVTRGLDPAVPVKDSGVPWLGMISRHWNVTAFKRTTTRVVVGIAEAATHAYTDEGVPIIRSTNVRANHLHTEDLLYIQPWFAEHNSSKSLYTGDLVTVRTGYPGVTAVVPESLDGSQCFTLLISTLLPNHNPDYFCFVLNSCFSRAYFEVEGWGSAQLNISVPILQYLPVPLPPSEEQEKIVEYLHIRLEKLDSILSRIHNGITGLQEYRAALISAAVTGQIDVRSEVNS